jgi:hypothetical protein
MLNDYRKSESEFGPIGTDFFNTIGQKQTLSACILSGGFGVNLDFLALARALMISARE